MKTITKTYLVRSFDELSPEEKQAALEKHRDWNVDHNWWAWTQDDFKNLCSHIGLQINDIFWSGFRNQGDGASFTGRYSFSPGGFETVKTYCSMPDLIPIMEEIHKLGSRDSALKENEGEFSVEVYKINHNYQHENTMGVYACGYESKDIGDWLAVFRSLAKWLYKILEREYNHLVSDEAVAESLLINNVEFETLQSE